MRKIERKNTGLLVTSSTISKIGDTLFDYVNNSFLASMNMKSMVLVGIYQALENVIGALFNLFGGVIADRFRRKKIIILSDFLSGLICLCLSLISKQTWLIYAVILTNALLAFLSAFSTPAYNAFTREIVEKDNITRVNSYLQTLATLVKIIVPMLALGIYHMIGIRGALGLDGLSFLLSALIVAFVQPILEEASKTDKFSVKIILEDLVSGFHYVAKNRQIYLLIALSAGVNFFMAGYSLLLPYSNQMFPKITGNSYAMFLTAEAIGGVIGAVISGKIRYKLSTGQLMALLSIFGGFVALAPVLYFLKPSIFLLALSPVGSGIFMTLFNIHSFSLVQREVASEYLGRVLGIVFTVAILFMPLGTALFTLIFTPSNPFNFFYIGCSVIILSFIFLKLLQGSKE
ncbi:MFS transporter [Streptococcus equinus]|uniref:Na+/melibiose symporter n=1 Tax=Streptococcus equinus TaxID=1335 RepID=A0A1H0XN43_STREI|nr:MFS transporter [Streptococcus equinus]SDQ04293.1 Na+/melibiose symporter [Streptococcus equinus]SDW10493.1 Na+/melibiose symporter [Streptococcus equinus]